MFSAATSANRHRIFLKPCASAHPGAILTEASKGRTNERHRSSTCLVRQFNGSHLRVLAVGCRRTAMKNDTGPEVASPLLSQKQAAQYLKRSISSLRRDRICGIGPEFVRIGRSIRYSVRDLQKGMCSMNPEMQQSESPYSVKIETETGQSD